MRIPSWLLLATRSAVFAVVVSTGRAEEGPAPQIEFVQVRLKDGAYSLVSTTNVPGVLKARRGPLAQDVQLVLEDGEGRELWTDGIADPAVRRLEYEDPARPGVIQVKEERLSEMEFTVRMPSRPGRRHLAIYRRPAGPTVAAPGRKAPSREFVTRLALPTETPP